MVPAALERFGLRPHRLRPLADEVVLVDTDDAQRFALRCRPVSDRLFGDIPLELAWTAALRRDTDIEPPEPVPGLDGALVQEVAVPAAIELPELPEPHEPHDCVLFRWIPGVELAQRLTPENVRRLGVLSARLHDHAATFQPPPELPVRTLDRLTRGDERDVLFTHDHPLFLPPQRRRVFEAIADRFHRELASLYAAPTN